MMGQSEDSREREGMFCVANIVYSDGRWERPYYTMNEDAARGYWDFLVSGGWRGMTFEQYRDGDWRDVALRGPSDGR